MGYFDATLPTTLTYKPTAVKTNIFAPEFDPDAGRQEAYNQRWKAYIDNLSQSNKKTDLNKAKQYFDAQFDQDWYNETGQRQQQFNKVFKPSREQEIQNSANAYNQFTTNLFNSFAKPQAMPKPAPKLKTEGLDFSNVQAVQNWLLANNYNPGKADNMYGIKTKTAIDTLLNDANSGLTEGEKQLFRNFQNSTRLVRNKVSPQTTGQRTVTTKQLAQELDNFENHISRDHGEDAYEYDRRESLDKKYGSKWVGIQYSTALGPESAERSSLRWFYGGNPNYRIGVDPRIQKQLEEERARARLHNYQVVANNPTKYQQGGRMNNQEEIQKAFMAYLIEDAAAQGVKIQSEQDLQAYAQQLGEEGLKAKYQEFMQKMQGGVKARLGAKLDYINKLKGSCPDGSEPYYFKEGGFMKKGCSCMQKAQKGVKTKMNEVDKFKAKRPTKYDGKKHERLAELNAHKKATPAQKDSLQAYQELYKKLPNDVKSKKYNDQTVDEKKCGGKAKKNK